MPAKPRSKKPQVAGRVRRTFGKAKDGLREFALTAGSCGAALAVLLLAHRFAIG